MPSLGGSKMIRSGFSCKPTSLVRDLVILQERGYKLERAVAVDMFPATANCETVAKLIRVK